MNGDAMDKQMGGSGGERYHPPKLTDDRISQIAHLIQTRLGQGHLVEYTDTDRALRIIKKTLIDSVKVEEEADQTARDKVASLKRGVTEGSREWEILYRKYFEEELGKRGR